MPITYPRVAASIMHLLAHMPRGRTRLSRLWCRLISSKTIAVSVYGPRLNRRPNDATFQFCVDGTYGFFFSDFVSRFPQRFRFLDIGANIGLYSLIAAANPRCEQCFSFEPNPVVYRSLLANIVLN